MVKNTFGGKGHKRGKNRPTNNKIKEVPIAKKDEGEVYGQVIKCQGGTHILVKCSDGKDRSCIIPGKFYNKVWIRKDDIVLVDTRATGVEDSNGLIVERYDHAGVRILKSKGEINFECEEEEEEIIDESINSAKNGNQKQVSEQPNRYDRDIDAESDDESKKEDEESSEEDEDDDESSESEEEPISVNKNYKRRGRY